MKSSRTGICLLTLLTLGIAAPAARADGDAHTFSRLGFDLRPPTCLFMDTIALRDEYANRGLRFRGPGPFDGGGVLSSCAFFLVVGYTPPCFMGYNEGAEFRDGGIPTGPQDISFNDPVNFVQVSAGASIEVGYPATITAFGADGQELGSSSIPLDQVTAPLRVEVPGISRVTISAPGARYIFDDLLWGESAGGDLLLDPATLTITTASGSVATGTLILGNGAGQELEFFVQERLPAVRGQTRSAELTALGDPVPMANLRDGRAAVPVRYTSIREGTRTLNLLVYTEIDPNGTNYDTDLDQALRSLDIPYTAFYGAMDPFREALASQSWDAVIFDHQIDSFYEAEFAVYDEILQYVQGGGRLIMCSWLMGERPDHPLWPALGFQYVENYQTAEPVVWTEVEPAFFDVPNDVPDFLMLGNFYYQNGQHLVVDENARVLANQKPGEGVLWPALILANGGRTLFRSFVDGACVIDRDNDGVLDTIELWRDLLVQMLATDFPWLSVAAEGAIPAGGQVELPVSVDAKDLAPGVYLARLEIQTNEAVHNDYFVDITLQVTDGLTNAVPDAEPAARLTAYPNPFNPTVNLTVDLPARDRVALQVHDTAGRLVRTLAEGTVMEAGRQTFRWDGKDRQGRSVSAGVYLVRLVTSEGEKLQRIALVR